MRTAGIHHVAVQVRDLGVAERFYAGVLDLPVVRRWPAEGGGERSLWLDAGGGSLLMLERAKPSAVPPSEAPFVHDHAGWHVVALRISPADRARWERRLVEHGVEVAYQSRWTLYVRDPDGNRVALSHHPDDVPEAT